MGAILFFLIICLLLSGYSLFWAIIWFFKYRNEMTFDEFEKKFNL